jgi:hypothetical protein
LESALVDGCDDVVEDRLVSTLVACERSAQPLDACVVAVNTRQAWTSSR